MRTWVSTSQNATKQRLNLSNGHELLFASSSLSPADAATEQRLNLKGGREFLLFSSNAELSCRGWWASLAPVSVSQSHPDLRGILGVDSSEDGLRRPYSHTTVVGHV